MKRLAFFILLLISTFSVIAQPGITPDKNGQLWNVTNGYYGTINSNTIDAATAIDTVNNTTSYLYLSDWNRSGRYAFDSARVLKVNTSGIGPYYQPYSQGLAGRGIISFTANVWKASSTNTVTPTVVLTPEQSPNGINGWVAVPGVTAATVSPTSRTTASSTTFNISDIYQRYVRVRVASTDTCSIQTFYNFKPKTY